MDSFLEEPQHLPVVDVVKTEQPSWHGRAGLFEWTVVKYRNLNSTNLYRMDLYYFSTHR